MIFVAVQHVEPRVSTIAHIRIESVEANTKAIDIIHNDSPAHNPH